MSQFKLADVAVPEKYAEWAFEYRLGYNDGATKKKYAWSPRLGGFKYHERRKAYTAGREAGRKAVK